MINLSARVGRVFLQALCLSAALAAVADAQQCANRGLAVGPPDKCDLPQLSLTLERVPDPAVKVADQDNGQLLKPAAQDARLTFGTRLQICVTATHKGYITLWSVDSKDQTVRIYPNQYAHPNEPAGPIEKGETVCLGDGRQFTLRVQAPAGPSSVYAEWTADADEARLPSWQDPLVLRGAEPRSSGPDFAQARFGYVALPAQSRKE
jgi:hypothetical protein